MQNQEQYILVIYVVNLAILLFFSFPKKNLVLQILIPDGSYILREALLSNFTFFVSYQVPS